MYPNCTTNSSFSLQSPDPCRIKDDDVSQRMVACDISGTDVATATFGSISIAEVSLQKKNYQSKKDYKSC